MCGIVAFLSLEGPADLGDLTLATSMLRHRGPDDSGAVSLEGGRVALAHVRLSVVDLAGGKQPMRESGGHNHVVHNGEIYDHAEHRARLRERGVDFRTSSDTEVVLGLYRAYGFDAFAHLEGEFAFVLWDAREKRLVAVRDRFGVKPLFVARSSRNVIVASEAKAILALPGVKRAFDRAWLSGPMLSMAPKAASAFEGIEAVRPGHVAIFGLDGSYETYPYWKRTFSPRASMGVGEAAESVRGAVERAVRRRMVADVPVCTYLSGGIDSTIVASEMVRAGGAPIKAFSVGFSASDYDESSEAEETARALGLTFEKVPCTVDDLAENLVSTVRTVETFLANPSAVGKFLLSRRVRDDGYKVALTGEGADEIFAGYAFFKLERIWQLLLSEREVDRRRGEALLRRFRQLEARSEGILWNRSDHFREVSPRYGSYPLFLEVRASEFGRIGARLLDARRLGLGPSDAPSEAMWREFGADGLSSLDPLFASLHLSAAQLSSFVLPTLGDRVEMAHGVEARVPFLDRDLVDVVSEIPAEHHIELDDLREKAVLRRAFEDRVPARLRTGRKHPFFSPGWRAVHATRRGRELFGDYASRSTLARTGIFSPSFASIGTRVSRILPQSTGLARRLDVMAGVVLTTQILHAELVERRPRPERLLDLVVTTA